jgi:hypothetical protein
MNLERIKNFPKAEKLPEPVKNAAADSTVETKTIEVEEKPKEKKERNSGHLCIFHLYIW